jgi:hypothetical protein
MHLNVVRRRLLQGLVLLGFWLGAAGVHLQAQAQGVELASLNAMRQDGVLTLDLQRGVPVYFVAQVELRRNRWYWRDERVARVSRSWRVAYQPITGTWRVGLGGLNQTHASMQEALTAASRSAAWRLADLAQLDPDSRYSIVFSYHLDTAQLPGPLQFGLVGQSDWVLSVDRVLRLE